MVLVFSYIHSIHSLLANIINDSGTITFDVSLEEFNALAIMCVLIKPAYNLRTIFL